MRITHPIFPSNKKYRNVELVPVYNAGYQTYRQQLIAEKQAARSTTANEITEKVIDPICAIARTTEYIVRKCFGSSPNRILKYDVFYAGRYVTNYAECDLIHFEPDGSVTVGEIKTSSRPSVYKAASQLKRSCEILSSLFKKVNPVSIVVDTTSLDETLLVSSTCDSGSLTFRGVVYSLQSIITFAKKAHIEIDMSLFMKAYTFSQELLKNRLERQTVKSQTSLEPLNVIVDNSFAFLLQKALCNKAV